MKHIDPKILQTCLFEIIKSIKIIFRFLVSIHFYVWFSSSIILHSTGMGVRSNRDFKLPVGVYKCDMWQCYKNVQLHDFWAPGKVGTQNVLVHSVHNTRYAHTSR